RPAPAGDRAALARAEPRHEACSLFDRHARKRDKLVSGVRIDSNHRVAGALGLLEGLLALGVLRKDVPPGRRYEDATMIAIARRRGIHVRRNRNPAERQVAEHIRDPAVEEYRAGRALE